MSGTQLALFNFDSTVIPDIDFCVKDASAVESDVISNYEKYFYLITKISMTLGRGDPRRLFLISIIYQLVVQRSIVDSTGKENLLKYSHGADLDNLGARWGNRGLRLGPQYATTTLRFTLANTLTTNSTIPLGTLAQTSNQIRFETTKEDTIPSGQLSVDIPARAINSGMDYNGLVAGQINQLVSWNSPFLVDVINTTTTSGGTDIESDDHLRARIWMAPESFSTAGPYGAYEYWAASANPDIIDVSVWSNAANAGKVYIYPLMEGGRMPTLEECQQVLDICNADDIRPLTDQVFCQPPAAINFTANVQYWVKTSDARTLGDIQVKVNQAFNDYLLWQGGKIGRDINPSKCDQMLVDAGAKRTDIPGSTTFIYTVVNPQSVAVNSGSVLNYAGLEDE